MKRKHIYNLNLNQLAKLRKQVVLCSIYLDGYINSYDIDESETCDFFDGFADYLSELMTENEKNYDDGQFFDYLSKYDTAENLESWFNIYCCGINY